MIITISHFQGTQKQVLPVPIIHGPVDSVHEIVKPPQPEPRHITTSLEPQHPLGKLCWSDDNTGIIISTSSY